MHIGLAPWLSHEIFVEAALCTKAFSINQDVIQAVDILVCSLYWLQIMENLVAARQTCCGTEQLDLMHVHNCIRILVESKPWPSLEVNYCCDTMAFFRWWFLQNAFSSIISCTASNMLQLLSHLSDSPSSILVNALQNSSVMWYLAAVFRRFKKCWPHTQVDQKTVSVLFEGYREFLDSSEPTQLDYLLPLAIPSDGREGCATTVSCENCAWFRARGAKVVLNCYSFMVRNEYRTGSTFCVATRNCDTYLKTSFLKFDSITDHLCYTMITSQCYVLLVPMQSLMVGQCTYGGDKLTTILERLTVCCRWRAMSQNQEVPCKRMNEEESDWVLHVLSQSSYLGMISKMGAALNILPSMFPVTKGMKTEGNIRQLLRGSEILSTYSLKGCKNSPLQLIDTSSLGKIWFAHEFNEPWHPGMFFSSCAMLSLMVHFVRRTIRDGSSSVKKTCDLIRPIYHLNDGQGTRISGYGNTDGECRFSACSISIDAAEV